MRERVSVGQELVPKPPTPEQRRETVEYFALQALFRWPGIARELELTAGHFRGSTARSSLAKAALEARFLTPQASVPVQTTAAAAGVPLDVAAGMLSMGGLHDPAAGRAYLLELLTIERALLLTQAVESAVRCSLPEELEDALQAVLLDHTRRHSGRSAGALPSLQRIALDYIDEREALAAAGRESALPYGPALPRTTELLRGGHHRGEVTNIIAGPGVGKTTFSRYLQLQLGRAGIYTYDFSGEMAEEQQGERLVHAEARRPMSESLLPGDLQRARQAIEVSEAATHVIVDARSYLAPDHILSAILAGKARYGDIGLAVVDHLGKVRDRRRGGDDRKEWERFAAAADELKSIAMETRVPIMVLQHMTTAEGANETANWEPKKDSGRGGGAMSFETDVMLALWRYKTQTWLKILKCRQNGEANNQKVELHYNAGLQSFSEVDTLDFRR